MSAGDHFPQLVLDALSSHVAILDRQGTIISVNRAWRAFAEANGLMGNACEGADYLSVCDRAAGQSTEGACEFAAGLRSVLDGSAESFEIEYPCNSPEEERWFMGKVTPVMFEGKRYAVVSHENITERKLSEQQIKDQEEELSAVYENAPVILMLVDQERRIRKINNQAALRFAGSSSDKMHGLRGGEALRCIHALDDPQGCGFGEYCELCTVRLMVLDALHTGNNHHQVEVHLPVLINGKREELFFLLSTIRLNIKEQPMALICLLDITVSKLAEKEMARLKDELRQAQKMEAVGRLAGGVVHEFNNLMQAILGQADLLKSDLPMDSLNDPKLYEIKEIIAEIVKAAKKGGELTAHLLTFSRRQVTYPASLNLNDVVLDVLKMIRPAIGEHIDMRFTPVENLSNILADKGQIEILLVNLCLNARDAMPEGGSIIIETQNVSSKEDPFREDPWSLEKDGVLLIVSDTGYGMDEAIRTRVFEPFFTTKKAGQGTGLGLAIIYGIVQQHEGMVHVSSEPGKGTSFMIYLPLKSSRESIE